MIDKTEKTNQNQPKQALTAGLLGRAPTFTNRYDHNLAREARLISVNVCVYVK
jgi:hypothetical protein